MGVVDERASNFADLKGDLNKELSTNISVTMIIKIPRRLFKTNTSDSGTVDVGSEGGEVSDGGSEEGNVEVKEGVEEGRHGGEVARKWGQGTM